MGRYIFQRVWTSAVTLFVVITVTFFLMRAIPGGPFTDEKAIPPQILTKVLERYHMNDPIHIQYFHYLQSLARFDLGPSFRYEGMSVNDLIRNSFPISLLIGSMAILIALGIGIPAGIVSALRRGGWQDKTAMVVATLGITIPNYVIATLMVYVFAYRLGIVTVGFSEADPVTLGRSAGG